MIISNDTFQEKVNKNRGRESDDALTYLRWGDQGGPPRRGDIGAKGGRNWSWEDLERRFHGEGTARAKVLRWESGKSV